MKKNNGMVKLYEIRKSKGFSRRELSALSGIKEQTITALEWGATNYRNAKISTLIALAKALHCKVIDLFEKDLQRYIAKAK